MTSPLVVLENVSMRLGARRVIQNLSLVWPGPGVLAVMGENGAGKSTLLRLLSGILSPSEGDIRLAGIPLRSRRAEALRVVGYAPEATELPPHLSTAGLVALVAALKGVPRPPLSLAARLGVTDFLDRPLVALSLGQRRRASIFAAITGDPALLVLDEPTNGLDEEGITMLCDLLRERSERGLATIAATHDPAFVVQVFAEILKLEPSSIEAPASHPDA